MKHAQVEVLALILDKQYSLVHITGYHQPKNEWLGVIRNREFEYHDINVQQESLKIEQRGDIAEVKGRGIFNATIWGMKNHWRLQFRLQFEKHKGEWKIMSAEYKTF